MDRKTQYKHPASDIVSLRERKREQEIVLRKQKRDKVLLSKRVRYDEADSTTGDSNFTIKQVECIGKDIQKGSNDRLGLLKQLKKAFAEAITFIDVFLRVDGALRSLIGLLTGNDPALQIEASWCLTNLAAGNNHHTALALKHAAPYFITYLQGHNTALQDQCCWGLGNIAGDGPEFRDTLVKQGAVQPLVNLLKSPVPRVVQSAAFALSNLIRGPDSDVRCLIEADVARLLLPHVKMEADNLPVLSEVAWVLAYAVASGEFEEEFVSHGAIPKVVDVICQCAASAIQDCQALTPLIRCLGNLCSGPIENITMATQNGCLLLALPSLLNSHQNHIRKESLWLLSNILVDVSVCQAVLESPLLISCILQRCGETFNIKREALVCLCNLAFNGDSYCQKLHRHGTIHATITLLRSPDPELLSRALYFHGMMLKCCKESRKVFEEQDGVNYLEALELHGNHTIQEHAHKLLDEYFSDSQEMKEFGNES